MRSLITGTQGFIGGHPFQLPYTKTLVLEIIRPFLSADSSPLFEQFASKGYASRQTPPGVFLIWTEAAV